MTTFNVLRLDLVYYPADVAAPVPLDGAYPLAIPETRERRYEFDTEQTIQTGAPVAFSAEFDTQQTIVRSRAYEFDTEQDIVDDLKRYEFDTQQTVVQEGLTNHFDTKQVFTLGAIPFRAVFDTEQEIVNNSREYEFDTKQSIRGRVSFYFDTRQAFAGGDVAVGGRSGSWEHL